MPWKTGRSRTLSASGSITGTAIGNAQTANAMVVNPSFHLLAFGCEILGEADPQPAGTSSAYWTVIAVAGGSPAQNHNPNELSNNNSQNSWTYSLDISGTFSMSVDVEEWIDITYTPWGSDALGVFDCPGLASLRVYELTKPGGTATATITSGGVTATHSITQAGGDTISYTATLTGSLTSNALTEYVFSGGPNPTLIEHGSASSLGITASYNGAAIGGTQSLSGGGCNASNVGGISISLPQPVGSGGGAGAGTYATYIASATANNAPDKAFSMSGNFYAMDATYSDTIPVLCSRFAGDTASTINASGGAFSTGYSQRLSACNATATGYPHTGSPVVFFNSSTSMNEWQPVSATVDTAWCTANNNYVTVQVTDDAGNLSNRYFYDNQLHFKGWLIGNISLSQSLSLAVDNCSSATHWTGAAVGGGGLQNTGASMSRSWSPGSFDFSGYRYLRLHQVSVDTGSHPLTLSMGGKTWTRTVTTTATDIDIDLCDPDTGGATSDLTDTRWPISDPSLTYDGSIDDLPSPDGPLWGVGFVAALTVGGLSAGRTYTIQGITQERLSEVQLSFVSAFSPRFGQDMLQESPGSQVPTAGGHVTTSITKVRRGIVGMTDGRQSFEYRDFAVTQTIGGDSGVVSNALTQFPISRLISDMNGINGWSVSTSAPANDGSSNIHNGLLNQDTAASVAGACHVPGNIGLNAGSGVSIPSYFLITSIDWYPDCGDLFGGGSIGGAIVLHFDKTYRAQSHGILLTSDKHVAPATSTATLYPGAGEVQPSGTAVGTATADTAQAVFRTSGTALDGFIVTHASGGFNAGGAPNPDAIIVNPAPGTVQAKINSYSPRSMTQTFRTRKLSRVAMRLPITVIKATGVANLAHKSGPFHLAAPLFDSGGSPAGLGYWRSDLGAPRFWDIAANPITTGTGDNNPHLCQHHSGRLLCAFDRDNGSATSGSTDAFETHSDDDGISWSAAAMTISNGKYPVVRCGKDGSIYRMAYVDDGTSNHTGTLKGQWQSPGDASPSAAFDIKNSTGTIIAVAEGSFGLDHLAENSSRWILSVVLVGGTTPTEYVSADDIGGTWIAA